MGDVAVCVACVTQRGEADWHRVGTSTGTAQPAHLSGCWNTIHKISLQIPSSWLKNHSLISSHSIHFSKCLSLTCGLFNMAPGPSHHDGGVFVAEAGASNSQKSPQAIRSWRRGGVFTTHVTFTTISIFGVSTQKHTYRRRYFSAKADNLLISFPNYPNQTWNILETAVTVFHFGVIYCLWYQTLH